MEATSDTKYINLEKHGFIHINEAADVADTWIRKIGTGEIRPYQFKSPKMNADIGGVLPGEQVVIAARTGVGKSAFVNEVLDGFSDPDLNKGFLSIFLYWSVEMKSWRQIVRMYSAGSLKVADSAAIEPMSVKDILSHKNPLQQESLAILMKIRQDLAKRPIFFRDQTSTALKWEETVRSIQVANPEATLINIWDHTRLVMAHNEKSEEQKITNLMDAGMRTKNDIDCINIWLSQMNRNIESQNGSAEIGARAPIASDVFGSDAVQQFADILMAPHRPENYRIRLYLNRYPTENLFALHVLKQRDGWTGMIRLRHNLKYNSFSDWEDD